MTIELGMIVPHTPRMVFEDQTPGFQRELVKGMHEAAKAIESAQPDAIVLITCHWPSTFHHFVDATPVHKGVLTALECPELISDVPYNYPGDADLGIQLVNAGRNAGLSIVKVNDPTYVWDYGTVVPLRYLVPKENIPVINLSVTLTADLQETYFWVQQIGKVLRESKKRVVFVSSDALSHNLVRGPELMPSLSEQALDKKLEYLHSRDLQAAWEMLPQYAKIAHVESGGRYLAMLFGVLEGSYKSKNLGYGQSSASANVVMTFEPQ
jgi:3,4-dihydroxyphenylacetate 2,3-dioxygenase